MCLNLYPTPACTIAIHGDGRGEQTTPGEMEGHDSHPGPGMARPETGGDTAGRRILERTGEIVELGRHEESCADSVESMTRG